MDELKNYESDKNLNKYNFLFITLLASDEKWKSNFSFTTLLRGIKVVKYSQPKLIRKIILVH